MLRQRLTNANQYSESDDLQETGNADPTIALPIIIQIL
jgi:hypothetical protein